MSRPTTFKTTSVGKRVQLLACRYYKIRLAYEAMVADNRPASEIKRLAGIKLRLRNELVERTMFLVWNAVRASVPGGTQNADFEDMVGDSYEVQIKCIERFDPAIKMLTTYIYSSVRYYIWQGMQRKIERLHGATVKPLDLNFVSVGMDDPRAELDECEVRERTAARVQAAIDTLSERDQAIVRARFRDDKPETFNALARTHGITKQRCQQVNSLAIRRLTQVLSRPMAG